MELVGDDDPSIACTFMLKQMFLTIARVLALHRGESTPRVELYIKHLQTKVAILHSPEHSHRICEITVSENFSEGFICRRCCACIVRVFVERTRNRQGVCTQ